MYETVVILTMEDIAELLGDSSEGRLNPAHMVDFTPDLTDNDTYIATYRSDGTP